jgi:MFS family permease
MTLTNPGSTRSERAPDAIPIRSLIAAIAAISITGFGLSMSYPLFSLLLDRMGASGFEIGLNAAAPAIAILVGSPLMPLVLRRVGLVRLLVGAAIVLAATMLLFKPLQDVWIWMALRFVYGFGAVAAFYGSELWIISVAPAKRRGMLLGIYGVCLSFGFFLGPVTLGFVGIEGAAPFVIAAALALAAIIPVVWARDEAPQDLGGPAQSFGEGLRGSLRFFRTDPTVMTAVITFGVIEFGAFALFPVWGVGVGMTTAAAIALVALLTLGNVLLQVPIGVLADKLNRRCLLMGSALICMLCPLLLAGPAATGWPLWAVTVALGGVTTGLYTISLAELGARYSGEALARGTAAYMTAYGVGALCAPPVMGWMMDLLGPNGLMWSAAFAAAGFLLLTLSRARMARVRA